MRKRELLARIEALERRVAQLEARPTWMPPQITWGDNSAKPIQVREHVWRDVVGGSTAVPQYDVDYTYEGMLLEDRDAYAG